jgi:sarcosine oxidase, subunit gamma
MLELRSETALTHRAEATNTSVLVREIADRGMIDLRGLSSDRKFIAAVKAVLNVDLPKQPRTSAAWGDIKALWLSVDQWLILCPREKAASLEAELRTALEKTHSLVVNVSDMRTIIRLDGAGVRETIMKGTSLDLLDGSYETGAVRRMRFAEIAALLHVVDSNVFDIYVFRSYADYAWEFLLRAARRGAEVRLFGGAAD